MAPKTPDLNLLPIVVALYDELSVSRAARRLGHESAGGEQGAAPAARDVRRSTVRPRTQRHRPDAARSRDRPRSPAAPPASQEDLLKGERFDPATSTRPIVLGLSDIAEMAFLPSILDHFRVHAPKCPVRSVTVPDVKLADGLEKGDVDVAAGYFPALAQRNFRQRRLSKHGFACLMRAGHPLWKSRLTVSAYLAAEHIAIRREGRSQELLERFIERRKMRRKIAMYTSNVLSVPFIVMDTQLVATLPYAVVTRFASITSQVVAALPPFDLTYDLKLHWHRRFDNEPRSIWLREQLAAVFKDHQWLEPPPGPAPFLES